MSPGQADNRSERDVNAVAAVFPHQTALDRLKYFHSRNSFMHDLRHNWTGWLFSLLFHVSIVVFASFMVTVAVTDAGP